MPSFPRKPGNTWQRILPKPGNPGFSCCHIMIRRLARIYWVKTAPSRIRAASSNPAHTQHKGSCGLPALSIHVHWHGHMEATKSRRSRRSGWRDNRRSYHASPINRGAGEALLPPRTLAFSPPFARRATAAAPCASCSRLSAASPEKPPEPRRAPRWGIALPPSSTSPPVRFPFPP